MSQPTINQIVQFLKDFSFENFASDAPDFAGSPVFDININVEPRHLGEPKNTDGKLTGNYEVVLSLRAHAKPAGEDGIAAEDAKPLFLIEVAYAGRYAVADIPAAELEPFLLIEAPRLLFPFARQIIADAVMQGGLPPLLLAPIDFVQIYQQRKQALAAKAS
jgi:preprotein translocase subunit SecB